MAKSNDRSQKMRDKTKQRAAEAESSGFYPYLIIPEKTKVQYFNPKKGTYEIDVIPYEVTKPKGNPDGLEKGDLFHRRLIYAHDQVGASNKKYLCRKTIGEKCPICEARAALYAEGTAESKALAGKLKARVRELRNIINITDATEEKKGIQIWNSSYPLVGDLLEKEIRDSTRKDRSGFALLEGGATLTIRFDEKTIGDGPNNKPFPFADRIDFENRGDYDENILEDCFDLDSILDVKSYDELEKIFLEVEDEKDEEDNDPPKRSRKSKEEPEEEAPKRSRKAKEEEPEEDTPKRKKKAVEEEEEAPKRSRKSEEKEPEPEDYEPEEGAYVTITDEDGDEATGTVTTLTSKKITIEDADGDEQTFKIADVTIVIAEAPKKKKKKEEEEPPKRSRKAKEEEPGEKPKSKAKGEDEQVCPVKKGTFGEDCDEFDECFECDLWKKCKKAKG